MKAALMLILGAYAISFFLPVTDSGSPRVMYGFQAFFWGLSTIAYLPMWSANVMLWIGCSYYANRRWKAATMAGVLATVLGVSGISFWDDSPESGYYTWIGSMILLSSTATMLWFSQRLPNRND